MKIQQYSTWLALPLIALFWAGAASAVSVNPGITGIAVGSAGSETMVGSLGDGESLDNGIKYYIPLRDGTNGTYGVTAVSECGSWPKVNGIAGTCWDKGYGSGYDDADALQMNIFFDLTGKVPAQSASLSFIFDDLDLATVNDPEGFFESISLSYWNWNGTDFDTAPVQPDGTIKTTAGLPDSNQFPGDDNLITWDQDLITWDLNMAALDALNASGQSDEKGFWIQLGFGSEYTHKGRNTPEYLAASLTVSPVPLPSAVWLFGSALLGFIGMSRRTRV